MALNAHTYHAPVMTAEVIEWLDVRPGGAYVDCTLGDGGHAYAILEASAPDGRVLGLDADPDAIPVASERLGCFGSRASVVNANFRAVASVAQASGFAPADGVLFDLGLSSRQLDLAERGFSFRRSAPLDMRFAPDGASAAELVNGLPEEELANLIYAYGEEPRSRRIARAIVAARPLTDAAELADVVARASGYRKGRTHPATRTFQALRIATNDEIGSLRSGLAQAASILSDKGRMVTIAYHSLEDREIKRFIGSGAVHPLTKHVIKPRTDETSGNRRSRSARMRIAEHL